MSGNEEESSAINTVVPAGDTPADPTAVELQPTHGVVVRFRVPGQARTFGTRDAAVSRGAAVMVESDRGLQVGHVLSARTLAAGERPQEQVVRLVSSEDEHVIQRNRVREREAFRFCKERIYAMKLPMKLIAVELAHSGSAATFYFTSDDRVDFRALVKDLARRFHTRIEMRQIGVRDAARHTGGVGVCGRELCCSTWLPEFKPISVRMAKDQNLALNHDKLSGLCGRLKCCLHYEQETYEAQRKALPKVGKRVLTPSGEGRVKDVNVLKRRVRVQFADGHYEELDAAVVSRPAETQVREGAPPRVAKAVSTSDDSMVNIAAQPASTSAPAGGVTEPGAPKKRRRRRRKRRGRGGDNRKGGSK